MTDQPSRQVSARRHDTTDRPLGVDPLATVASVRRLSRSGQLLVAQIAKRHKLPVSDLNALVRIVDWGDVTPSVLARSLPLDQSSATELGDRLERAGLITRTRVPHDRRLVSLKPTKRGEKVVATAFGPVLDNLTEIIEATPPSDRAVIDHFLATVQASLDELLDAPVAPSRRSVV